jgi:hypothetical protein
MLRPLIESTKENLLHYGFCPKFAAVLVEPLKAHKNYDLLAEKAFWDTYNIPPGARDPIGIFAVECNAFVRFTFGDSHEFGWLYHDCADYDFQTRTEEGAKAIVWCLPFTTVDEAEESNLDELIGFSRKEDAIKLWREGGISAEWLEDLQPKGGEQAAK